MLPALAKKAFENWNGKNSPAGAFDARSYALLKQLIGDDVDKKLTIDLARIDRIINKAIKHLSHEDAIALRAALDALKDRLTDRDRGEKRGSLQGKFVIFEHEGGGVDWQRYQLGDFLVVDGMIQK